MTKKDLIKRLANFSDDDVVIVSDSNGWCNINRVKQDGSCIKLIEEKYPVFSDN
jgi:hypothetical protein